METSAGLGPATPTRLPAILGSSTGCRSCSEGPSGAGYRTRIFLVRGQRSARVETLSRTPSHDETGLSSTSIAAAERARERGYVIDGSCPRGLTPVSKRVIGVPGDRTQVAMSGLAVNTAVVPNSELKHFDSLGLRPAHTGNGEILLTQGHSFVIEMDRSGSWNRRHFGALSARQIVAGARSLWTP